MQSNKKEVFTNENLDDYRNNIKIMNALNGAKLLTHDEFMSWYSPPEIKMSTRKPPVLTRQKSIEKVQQISNAILNDMSEVVCEKKIGENYGKLAIKRLNMSHFDILVAVAPDYDKIKKEEITTKTSTALKKKMRHILGFIIVEKGECKKLPNVYSINLICSKSALDYKVYKKSINERNRIKGSILLGAYIHCIKKIKQPIGILELANGYKNINGFFSYSRMGFVKDLSLFTPYYEQATILREKGIESELRCFNDYSCLPMSIMVDDYTYEQNINYASGKEKLENIADDTGFINLIPTSQRQREIQKLIATYCNLLYQFEYALKGNYSITNEQEIDILTWFEIDFYNHFDEEPQIEDYEDYLNRRIDSLVKEFYSKSPSPFILDELSEKQIHENIKNHKKNSKTKHIKHTQSLNSRLLKRNKTMKRGHTI